MLDDNEHAGLASLATPEGDPLEDGTRVSRGQWPESRPDDPRHFVIVVPAHGKTLVYWGTPRVKAALEAAEWPRVYRERNEIQEHSFKRMIDHGALNINYGRKTVVGQDRHQQRARAKLEKKLEAAQKRVDKKTAEVKAQQDKVVESTSQGHGKRLAQRQGALVEMAKELQDAQHNHADLTKQAFALGPPGERADRDFRKQTIMTVRTLLLENALTSFMAVLLGLLPRPVSLEGLLKILFKRSGTRVETDSQVLYWINTTGLSVSYHRLLAEIVNGLCALDLRYQGKPVQVRLKATPP